jgi:hypothetical protein
MGTANWRVACEIPGTLVAVWSSSSRSATVRALSSFTSRIFRSTTSTESASNPNRTWRTWPRLRTKSPAPTSRIRASEI